MTSPSTFRWMRWLALIYLAVWVPAYARVWGWANFLHLCDIAVIVTCVSLWRPNPLLISSQGISTLMVSLIWNIDTVWRFFSGWHLIGGMEYLWDSSFPMWVRLLSFFHLIFPILLLWLLLHVGYDRHGWILQSGVAVVVLAICRLAGSELNINFAFRDPLFNRSWGPAPLHLVVITSGLISLIYWPTHVVLARFLSPPGKVH